MYKKIIMISAVTAAAFLFSGCSGKDVKIQKISSEKRSFEVHTNTSFTMARSINATNINFLQAVAEETIDSGYSSFVFDNPLGRADVIPGPLSEVTSASDFIDKCANKSAIGNIALGVATLGIASNWVFDDCRIFFNPILSYSYEGSYGNIIMSNDSTAINAQGIVADLKSMGYYKTLTHEYIP